MNDDYGLTVDKSTIAADRRILVFALAANFGAWIVVGLAILLAVTR